MTSCHDVTKTTEAYVDFFHITWVVYVVVYVGDVVLMYTGTYAVYGDQRAVFANPT